MDTSALAGSVIHKHQAKTSGLFPKARRLGQPTAGLRKCVGSCQDRGDKKADFFQKSAFFGCGCDRLFLGWWLWVMDPAKTKGNPGKGHFFLR